MRFIYPASKVVNINNEMKVLKIYVIQTYDYVLISIGGTQRS